MPASTGGMTAQTILDAAISRCSLEPGATVVGVVDDASAQNRSPIGRWDIPGNELPAQQGAGGTDGEDDREEVPTYPQEVHQPFA